MAVNFQAMAIRANTNNLKLSPRVRSVDKRPDKKTRRFLSQPLTIFVGIVIGAAPVTAFFVTEIDQKNFSLADLEQENKNLGDQVASLSSENKDKSEQLLDLSNKVLEWQGKYARDMTSLSSALEKAQQDITVIFSEVAPEDRLLNSLSDNSGSWFINFETYSDKSTAVIRSKQIRDALVAVDLSVVEGQASSGTPVFRVRASGFPDKETTEQASIWIAERLDTTDLWIGDADQEKALARSRPDPRRVLRYVVLVGEYAESVQAKSVAKALTDNGLAAKSAPFVQGERKTFRVYIPEIATKDRAEAVLRSLTKTGSFRGAKLMKSFNVES